MDKTRAAQIQRLFLVEALPEPLTRASAHLQIFDNYIANTRMRIRAVRNPETKEWMRSLQQRLFEKPAALACVKISEMRLDEAEYEQFKIFEGSEIRKNRYFHDFDGRPMAFDVYLGDLWGLNVAKIEFQSMAEAEDFGPPVFALFEVTREPFFDGASLVEKKIDDVRAAIEKLEPLEKSIGGRNVD
ncbi:MAG: hypothetical protein LC730_01290 [Acidobacteria bacterium]|nr:hypothetical protein [Acidobacteriota bacterium]MCA1608081.1 hypothetical protein [Acidobacteriota bacterium]